MTYIGLTAVFLFIIWLVDSKPRPLGTILIVRGILVALLANGYTLMGVPTMLVASPALMKIAFTVVLGGIAWNLLNSIPSSTRVQESNHV